MKHVKSYISIILVIAMVFVMAVTVFADTTGTETGSITIENPVEGETYSIYKIFDLSYDSGTQSYVYTIESNSPWYDFVTGDGTGASYVKIDESGYVTWMKESDKNAADFAEAALEYANDNSDEFSAIKKTLPKKNDDGSTTYTASGLELGYYLVDSSLEGSPCILATTDPTAEIVEKNDLPWIEKEVKVYEGDPTRSDDDIWGDSNTASIGEPINFRTTVHAKKDAENYVVHDKMSAGLTFDGFDSITVKVGEDDLEKDVDYSVHEGTETGEGAEKCDFEIAFTSKYLRSIIENTDIVIEYTATLNENAIIGNSANLINVNKNETKLTYGNDGSTIWDTTTTYTYQFDLVKTKNDNTVLEGAQFELYDAATGGNKIDLVKITVEGTEEVYYRVATAKDKKAEGEDFTSAKIEAGQAEIRGLGNGTYWLEETDAPAGYNKLQDRTEVKIEGANLDATVITANENELYDNGGVQVINETGNELPSTGGIGTTIFYVLGFILVAGAVVLFVTRRRMNAEK